MCLREDEVPSKAAPGILAQVGLGSCPLQLAGLNQLQPGGIELPRPWHQTLIRKDLALDYATSERTARKIQFELERQLPAWESREERTSSS